MKKRTRLIASLSLAVALGCGPTRPTPPEEPCAAVLPGDLVVTEFMADPAGSDTGKQYVEVYNSTDHTLDLSGLSVFQSMADGSRLNASVLPATIVAPHAYFVLGDAGTEAAARPAYLNYGYGSDLGALRHENGKVGLRCSTTTIAEVTYASVTPGHARVFDGAKTPTATEATLAANWCDANQPLDALAPPGENFGSPGAPNQPCPALLQNAADAGTSVVHSAGSGGSAATGIGGNNSAASDAGSGKQCFDPQLGSRRAVNRVNPGDLMITEIMPAPSINDNGAGEWFEVLAMRTVDLNGLELVNEGAGSTLLSGDTCLTVAVNGWWVFARSSDPAQNGGLPTPVATFDFTLANSSSSSYPERALGLRIDGQEVDRAVWTKSIKGTSLQRAPADVIQPSKAEWCPAASDSQFGAGDRGTPGAANTPCTVEQLDAGSASSDAGNVASGGTQSTSAATTRNASLGGNGGASSVHAGGTSPVHMGGTASLHSAAGGNPAQTGGAGFCLGGAPMVDAGGASAGAPQGGATTTVCVDAGTGGTSVIDAGRGSTCVDASGTTRTPIAPSPGDLVITEVMSAPSLNNNGGAEWFEVLVNADLDLNGLELANENTGTLTVAGDTCLHVERGDRLVFARSADAAQNGGLPFVTLMFAFTLADSASNTHPERAVILRFGGAEISRAEWTKSTKGASWQREDPGTSGDAGFADTDSGAEPDTWCLTPGAFVFGLGDRGTPGFPNVPCN